MNSDLIVSWLVHSDWLLLALWIVLLATATGMSFPEQSIAEREQARHSEGVPPLP